MPISIFRFLCPLPSSVIIFTPTPTTSTSPAHTPTHTPHTTQVTPFCHAIKVVPPASPSGSGRQCSRRRSLSSTGRQGQPPHARHGQGDTPCRHGARDGRLGDGGTFLLSLWAVWVSSCFAAKYVNLCWSDSLWACGHAPSLPWDLPVVQISSAFQASHSHVLYPSPSPIFPLFLPGPAPPAPDQNRGQHHLHHHLLQRRRPGLRQGQGLPDRPLLPLRLRRACRRHP